MHRDREGRTAPDEQCVAIHSKAHNILLNLHAIPHSLENMERTNSSKHILCKSSSSSTMETLAHHEQIYTYAFERPSTLHTSSRGYDHRSGVAEVNDSIHVNVFVYRAWECCTDFYYSFRWDCIWTVEVCSYVSSLITFTILVSTLLVHQSKPIPEWPQLISVNSIVSLFALFMRVGVGLILAEGTWSSLES